MSTINRRSFIAGASFGIAGTVVAMPGAREIGLVPQRELVIEQALAIYKRLSPRRQALFLELCHQMLAEQRVEIAIAGRVS